MTHPVIRMAEHLKTVTLPVASQTHITIPVAFVNGMLAGVQALDEPWATFLDEAGISPELLAQAGARITAAQYVALFRVLIERRQDECLGFLSRPLKPGSFALVARSTLGAPDLGTAIRRLSKTFWLLQDDLVLEPQRDGESVALAVRFNNPGAARHDFLHVLVLRVFWRLIAWLAGGRLPVTRFDFAFDTSPNLASYGVIFPAQLEFGRQQTAFWFDAEWLQCPMLRDETALRAFIADAQANIVAPGRGDGIYSARVRRHLQKSMPAWPDLGSTADALHLSSSTLQRRLTVEGASFQIIKDDLRRDMAIARLSSGTVSLGELAHEMGFAETGAFQRAFKVWTGSAPGAYRRGGARRRD